MPQLKYWDGTQYVPLLSGIDVGTADARYVKKSGDEMTGPLALPGDPTLALHASTKQYVEGTGRFHTVQASVASSSGVSALLSTVIDAGSGWGGGIVASGSSLLTPKSGYYLCSFHGVWGAGGAGSIRLMFMVDYDNGNSLPPGNQVYIGSAMYPTPSGTGSLTVQSASGIYYLTANHRIAMMGRQDSGAALTGTATFLIRSIPGM